MQVEPTTAPLDTGLGANYLNSNFGGADRNKVKTFVPQVLTHINRGKSDVLFIYKLVNWYKMVGTY